MVTQTSGRMRGAAQEGWQGPANFLLAWPGRRQWKLGWSSLVGPAQPGFLDGSQAALTPRNSQAAQQSDLPGGAEGDWFSWGSGRTLGRVSVVPANIRARLEQGTHRGLNITHLSI